MFVKRITAVTIKVKSLNIRRQLSNFFDSLAKKINSILSKQHSSVTVDAITSSNTDHLTDDVTMNVDQAAKSVSMIHPKVIIGPKKTKITKPTSIKAAAAKANAKSKVTPKGANQ